MIAEFLFLVAGLIVLAKSSDFVIVNAIKFSKATGINEMTVGFILIAVSTSIPELSIGIMSSLSGDGALSLGNVIGADIVNICLVFGVLAVMGMKIQHKDIDHLIYSFILVSIVAFFLLFFQYSDAAVGIFLLIVFYAFSKTVLEKGIEIKHVEDSRGRREKYAILSMFGVFIVLVSSRFVTDQAILLTSNIGLSETILGATLLSLGTTMPELSIGISAFRRGNTELAIGDGIGSVVSNLTVILGITSIINPVNIDVAAKIALIFLIFSSWMFVFIAKDIGINKKTGLMLLVMYAFYIIMMLRIS